MQISRQSQHFRKVNFSQGLNCVAGATLRCRFRGRRNTFESLGADFVAGAALSQGQSQISWRSTFTRSCTYFVPGAALSQSEAQNSWQAHHVRKVKYKVCGRCSTFARSSAKSVAGAALSQGQVQSSWQPQHFRACKPQLLSTKEVHFCSWGSKIGTFKYESST